MSALSYLIVHDCRAAGALGAAVLVRALRSSGAQVDWWFDPQRTGRTAKFWAEGVTHLLERPGAGDQHLVLFGITFNDRDPLGCRDSIRALKAAYGKLSIWTHRYPDGYRRSRLAFHISPDDLIYNPPDDVDFSDIGRHLGTYEKRLLTASLLANKTVPASGFPDEYIFSREVAESLEDDPYLTWSALVEGSYVSAGNERTPDSSPGHNSLLHIDQDFDAVENVAEVSIAHEHSKLVAPLLHNFVDSHNLPSSSIVLCWVGDYRLVLFRHDEGHELPSLRWLVENRFKTNVPSQLRGKHYGPQDTLYYSLPDGVSKAQIRAESLALAKRLAKAQNGGRFLSAALTRDVARVGNDILQGVDLSGRYTNESEPAIQIAEDTIYVLLHRSSRTNQRRATLTVPILASTAAATAFLFRQNGYNLFKVERALEGAVMGLSATRRLTWLHPVRGASDVQLPSRLRIDVRPQTPANTSEGSFAAQVHSELEQRKISTMDSALASVSTESTIGRFLRHLGMTKLVCYNETETIGPSVAHSLVLLAAAKASRSLNRRERRAPVTVLDLFAGSGAANRLLSDNNIRVTSVDKYVSASTVGVDLAPDALWLRADVHDILRADSPMLEGDFDAIGLDPPHAELMDLLFAEHPQQSLTYACAKRSPLLVLYQGHTTQSGRLSLLEASLRASGWPLVSFVQVDEEIVVVAGTETMQERFGQLMGAIVSEVGNMIAAENLGEMSVGLLERDQRLDLTTNAAPLGTTTT